MKERRLHVLLLCVAILVFFHSVVSFPFLSWDDDINVTGNPLVSSASGEGLWQLWRHAYASLYVPVAYTWFWLLACASKLTAGGKGVDPVLFHAGNLVLHVVCTWMVYRVVSKLVMSQRAAFVGALVFAVHPLVAESVAWVTEARGLLSAAFALVALDLWLEAVRTRGGDEEQRQGVPRLRRGSDRRDTPVSTRSARAGRLVGGHVDRSGVELGGEDGGDLSGRVDEGVRGGGLGGLLGGSGWRLGLATLCFVAAMLAKPQAVVLPFVVIAIDVCVLRREWKKSAVLVGAWVVLAACVVVVTKLNQGEEMLHFVAPLWARPVVALDALGFYTCKVVMPVGLTTDYGRTPGWLIESIGRAWPAVVPVVVFGVLVGMRRGWKGVGAYAWFAIALLPVLGLVSFVFQDISTVADRYAYPAMAGVAFGVALLVERVPGELQWVAALVLGAGLGTMSSTQAATWSSNAALFTHVQSINPKSFKAEGNLGMIAYGAKRWDEAIGHYERALQFGPPRWLPEQMLGLAHAQKGDYAGAEEHFMKSLELRADNVGIEAMLGSVRLQLGKYEAAEGPFRHVLEVDPSRGDVREWLATALLAEGKNEEAAKEFQEALKTRDSAELRKNLAQALTISGDAKGAIEQLRNVLKTKAGWPDAEIDLAWLLATAPDEALRKPTEAMSLAVHAQSVEKVPSARFLDTLAAAEAATGRFEEAVKTAERAAKLIPVDQSGYAERVEKRRVAYASGKDWRDLVR